MDTSVLTPIPWSSESSHGLTGARSNSCFECQGSKALNFENPTLREQHQRFRPPSFFFLMLPNMFTSPDESRFTNAENTSLMIILFFQQLNKITLSVTCKSGVPFTCSFAWFRVLMQTPPDKKSANKRSADYVSLHPLLSITSPPLLLCQHVALWGHSDLDKVFSNLGRKESGFWCFMAPWPWITQHSAQTHRCLHWHGEGRTARAGTHRGCGRLGNCLCWCCLNSGGTKWQPQHTVTVR